MLQEIHLQAEVSLLPGRCQKVILGDIRTGFGYFLPTQYKAFTTAHSIVVNKVADPCKFVNRLNITNNSPKQITIGPEKVLGHWMGLVILNH